MEETKLDWLVCDHKSDAILGGCKCTYRCGNVSFLEEKVVLEGICGIEWE